MYSIYCNVKYNKLNYFQFAAEYATTHLMKNLKNKIVEVKALLDEKTESKKLFSNTPDNLTPQMKKKISKTETNSSTKTKPIATVDDSVVNHNKNKQDSLSLKKNTIPIQNAEDVTINPLTYLLRDGSINFSKLLIDEVLAADKLLIEAAKLTYDIAGNFFTNLKLIILLLKLY